jgi:glycosyltransferase involved in cell wall biosynthesis
MTAPRKKILHVLRSPRAEGTVKLALDLMRTPSAEHELLILESEPADLLDPLVAASRWSRVETKLPRGPVKFAWIYRKVMLACKSRHPDVVICWPNGFAAFVLAGAAVAGVRGLITHAGNPPTPTPFGRFHTLVTTGVVWALSGRMICCSNYVRDRFSAHAGLFSSVLRTVHNCAPIDAIEAVAAASRRERTDRIHRLIMVATLEGHKDHITLLRAMPAILRRIPNARLQVVGDGSLRGALEDECRALGVDSAVEFLGSRGDVPALLGQSDVFVFSTTEQEGLGTVLIEAMAAGLSVVATDVPACREVLEGGRWGRLVPRADSAALADAVVESISAMVLPDTDDRREALRGFLPDRMLSGYLAALA